MPRRLAPSGQEAFPLWDLPVRLFHWLLVVLVIGSWVTHELGEMELHKWCGYSVLTLVGFRILWGFVGSPQARFSDFVCGPWSVWHYLRSGTTDFRGHNPAGGWSVLALLGVLLAQGLTGLFATDEILFDGPYRPAVDSHTADWLTAIHKQNFNLLLALIGLHIAAVLYYRFRKGRDLIRPMLHGHDPQRPPSGPPAPWWRALASLAVSVGALATALALAPPPASLF
jgi:cytochrome b